ncbi:hypothetical protein FH972_007859 [Carpinus fangiana]|uniref:Uncharacterized protein n=1 Tax=Carpinus fangiana TaxID=176857 RepID=A0A5N6QWX0_9ROSI|nr:hypothetical protein FH972_007859 [Carpinus fangiana]
MGAKKQLVTVRKVTMRRHASMHLVHAPFQVATLSPHPSNYTYTSAGNIQLLQHASKSTTQHSDSAKARRMKMRLGSKSPFLSSTSTSIGVDSH